MQRSCVCAGYVVWVCVWKTLFLKPRTYAASLRMYGAIVIRNFGVILTRFQ